MSTVLEHLFRDVAEMRALGDITIVVGARVIELFHGIPEPAVRQADVLSDFREVGDAKGGAESFDDIHHGDAMETQRVVFDFKLGLWPIKGLVHQIKILQFHCTKLKGKTLKRGCECPSPLTRAALFNDRSDAECKNTSTALRNDALALCFPLSQSGLDVVV